MLTGRVACLAFPYAAAEHPQVAFKAAQVRLIFAAPITDHAVQVIRCDAGNGYPLGLQESQSAKADITTKLGLQQLGERHSKPPCGTFVFNDRWRERHGANSTAHSANNA